MIQPYHQGWRQIIMCGWLSVVPAIHAQATEATVNRVAGPPAILVNQVGYAQYGAKHALLRNLSVSSTTLDIINIQTQRVVGQARIGPTRADQHSLDQVADVQFDALTTIGRYQLRGTTVISPIFEVSAQPDQAVLRLLLRSYYLQRCGVALHDPQSGLQHGLDHAQDGLIRHANAVDQPDQAIAATGGWHDAGDYGKYVAPTSVAVAQLLDVYSLNPSHYPDGQLDIPESHNGRADILDEANVGLRWLLTMQRKDGAVWRKLSGTTWPKSLTPDQDTQTRYIFGISSPETAKFAAVMAQAARVYRTIDPAWSAQLQAAAERSWQWLKGIEEPQQIDWQVGDDSGSGKYLYSKTDQELSLLTDRDDRVWAAAELWLLTHQEEYLNTLVHERQLMSQLSLFEWKNTMLLGVVHMLREGGDHLDPQLAAELKIAVLDAADHALKRSQNSAYSLANHRFIWGSNKMVAAEGYVLAEAFRLTRYAPYQRAAQAQRDFLLGLNPQGISFVTGIGEQRVRHVAHLYARAAKQDIAGLLVGGANSLAQDQIAPKHQALYSYIDNDQAYSVNEYAIDYNSALIGLLGLLDATAGIEPVYP
jgi:endoglucanase